MQLNENAVEQFFAGSLIYGKKINFDMANRETFQLIDTIKLAVGDKA